MTASASSGAVADCCPQCGAPLLMEGERVICAYCGSSLIRRRGVRVDAAEATPARAWGIHLKNVSYVDQQGIGIEAFRMLIPADWEFEGGVQWTMSNPGMPAVIAFRASNPRGAEAFEAFPNIACYWTNNPMALGMLPVGSLYYGNEVRPPVPALQALQDLVIPRYRGQMTGLQIVQQQHLPDLVRELRARSPVAPTGVTGADGARVRVRYREGNREIEEDVFGVVEVSRSSVPIIMGATENTFWVADYLFSFRALAGTLDGLSDTFMAIVRSFRLNPQWYGRYRQVSQYMVQNQTQRIYNVGQISQIINQTHNQISHTIMDSYHQRQGTLDRLSTQFSRVIRGVDEYNDPIERQDVELPGGYEYAWSNALGEYVLTDDPGFDPNVGSNVEWGRMRRASAGHEDL